MAEMYVPDIQRPGFGYRRKGDDSSVWDSGYQDTAAPDAADASGANPFSPGMDWAGSQSLSVPDSRGGADTTPTPTDAGGNFTPYSLGRQLDQSTQPYTQTPDYLPSGTDWMNNNQQGAASAGTQGGFDIFSPPPDTQTVDIPTDTGTPGVEEQPMPGPSAVPPPVSSTIKAPAPGPQQQALKQMVAQGPKRSILGTIASMAAKGAAGYVNAASRTRYPVPVPSMRDLVWRAPGGGSWDTKLARQTQLAQIEQGEQQRDLTYQQMQAQAEDRRAQAEYYKQHGVYLQQEAQTHANAEVDRQKQQSLQRIIGMGGKTPQIRYFPANNVPKEVAQSSGWYVRTDPGDPSMKIAVRPDPGQVVDDETADILGIARGSSVPASTVNAGLRGKVSLANAAQAATEKENERLRREAADKNTVRHQTEMERIAAGNEADRAAARQQAQEAAREKISGAADTERANKLTTAGVWKQNAENKAIQEGYVGKDGEVSPAKQAEIDKEWRRQSQQAYDNWSLGIRNRGGTAADFTFGPDGSVVQSTESYGRGSKPVPLGSAPAPAAPVTAPTQPTGAGRGGRNAAPAQTTGGGRGAPKVPPAVNTTAATTETAPAAGEDNRPVSIPIPGQPHKSMNFANRAAAVKFFEDRGFKLGPPQ